MCCAISASLCRSVWTGGRAHGFAGKPKVNPAHKSGHSLAIKRNLGDARDAFDAPYHSGGSQPFLRKTRLNTLI